MNSKIRIVGVSDVSTGFGSPQVLALMKSLIEHYPGAEGILIEPDQPEIPPSQRGSSTFSTERIYTQFHPHHSPAGRIEYILRAAEKVNRIRPDVLVIYCTFSLPVLFKLAKRPSLVIYYAYEMTYAYGPRDIEMNRCIDRSLVDLIIYPEENRAVRDIKLCGHSDVPVKILLNCAEGGDGKPSIVSAGKRNGKILYAGTMDTERSFAGYFFHEKMQSISLDLFGKASGPDRESLAQRLQEMPRYYGYVDHVTLKAIQKAYCYSIVMWNPRDDQHLYAAPNKFFEAIAGGVPPIVAPHPQCKMIINRYNCGLVMDDWSFDAFYAAIQRGMEIYGTELYATMVDNCGKAFKEELNWDRQFSKIIPYLKSVKR